MVEAAFRLLALEHRGCLKPGPYYRCIISISASGIVMRLKRHTPSLTDDGLQIIPALVERWPAGSRGIHRAGCHSQHGKMLLPGRPQTHNSIHACMSYFPAFCGHYLSASWLWLS